MVCYEVRAAGLSGEGDCFLEPRHCAWGKRECERWVWRAERGRVWRWKEEGQWSTPDVVEEVGEEGDDENYQ